MTRRARRIISAHDRPAVIAQTGPKHGVGAQLYDGRREILRRVGHQQIAPGDKAHPFGGDARGNARQAGRQRRGHFPLDPGPIAQRGDAGDPGGQQLVQIRDKAMHFDPGGSDIENFRRRMRAHDM